MPPKRRCSISPPMPARRHRQARRDVAVAIRHIADPRFRRLLIPLLYDPAPEVADEAMESVRAAGTDGLRVRADAGRAAAQPRA